MSGRTFGLLGAAFCAALWPHGALGADMLRVTDTDGTTLLELPLEDDARWCMRWNHSVAGFAVNDCYAFSGGRMILEKSHQPDFAAGLGHIAGRGTQRAAEGGGYWIEDIDEDVKGNCYRLRVGAPAVNHRIVMDGREHSLSEIAARHSVAVSVNKEGETPSC